MQYRAVDTNSRRSLSEGGRDSSNIDSQEPGDPQPQFEPYVVTSGRNGNEVDTDGGKSPPQSDGPEHVSAPTSPWTKFSSRTSTAVLTGQDPVYTVPVSKPSFGAFVHAILDASRYL